MNIDILAIQEPLHTSQANPRPLIHNRLLPRHAHITDSKYCITIIDNTLAPAIVHTHITARVRCHCTTLKTTSAHITLLNIYDVQHTDKFSCNPAIKKAIATISKLFPDTSYTFLGDFQAQSPATTTQTLGTNPVPAPKHLVMHFLATSSPPYSSVVPQLHPTKPYITRWDRTSGRALDHIMAPKNATYTVIHAAIDHTHTQLITWIRIMN